jgi:UPF0755 protein
VLKVKIFFFTTIVFILLVLLFLIHFTLTYKYTGNDKFVIIKNNTAISEIAKILKNEDIFPHQSLLNIFLRVINQFYVLKAGEYKVENQSELYFTIQNMIRGKSYQRILTIPPGITNTEIVKLITQEIKDCNNINELDYENTYFFPDSYYFTYGMSCNFIINFIIENSNNILNKTWEGNNNPILKNKDELLILASIIEKESSRDDEIYNISGVFSNRIKNKIKLQADPTTIYSITKGKIKFNRALTTQDLLIKDDYNTYNILGLPPGKICNPSLNSLKAAANPADVNYLYFVADNNGKHLFSANLKQHQKNINSIKK